MLSERGFRLLLATRLLGQLSDGVLQAGLASYVLFSPERQATGAAIAASFAVLLLPYSVVGPFAGVLIDRWRRRQILLGANILRACIAVTLAALVLHGADSVGFVALALATLGVNRFILAALSAALPHVVAPIRLVTANAVSTTSGTVATATGAGAGLAARFWAGSSDAAAAGIVIAAAGAYLLAAIVSTLLRRDELGPDRSDGPPPRLGVREDVRELVAGVRYLHGVQRAWNALAALGVYRVTFGVMTVLVVLEQRGLFHDPGDADGGLRGVSVTFVALAIGRAARRAGDPGRRPPLGRSGAGSPRSSSSPGSAWLWPPCRSAPRRWSRPPSCSASAARPSRSASTRPCSGRSTTSTAAWSSRCTTCCSTWPSSRRSRSRRRSSPADGRSAGLVVFAAAILVAAGLLVPRGVTPPGWRPGQEEDSAAPDSGWSAHQASSSDSAVPASTGPRSSRSSSRKR